MNPRWTDRERADVTAFVQMSPRQLARRRGMTTTEAKALQAYFRLVLLADYRYRQGQPVDDLERKGLALFDELPMRIKRALWSDMELKRMTTSQVLVGQVR